jgi:hypothetical protein
MADLGGTVLADSTGELIGQQLNVQLSKPFAVFLIEGKPVLTYFAPLTDNSLETIEYRFVGSVNRSLLFAVAAAGLVAILLTTLLSRSMLRSIKPYRSCSGDGKGRSQPACEYPGRGRTGRAGQGFQCDGRRAGSPGKTAP